MQKEILRQKIRKRLNRIKSKTVQEKIIFKKLLYLQQFRTSKNIFTYVSRHDEVDTKKVIEYCIKKRKNVFVPKTDENTHMIHVYQIKRMSDLKIGPYGIFEPDEKRAKLSDRKKFDIILVPGLGFDVSCRRLGRGQGYFDRFLGQIKGYKIGLCFQEQMCTSIPVDKHDVPMDVVMTGK